MLRVSSIILLTNGHDIHKQTIWFPNFCIVHHQDSDTSRQNSFWNNSEKENTWYKSWEPVPLFCFECTFKTVIYCNSTVFLKPKPIQFYILKRLSKRFKNLLCRHVSRQSQDKELQHRITDIKPISRIYGASALAAVLVQPPQQNQQ